MADGRLIDGLGLWGERLAVERSRHRAALFLDRDGVIIEDLGYVGSADRVRLIGGAGESIARVNRQGFPVVVVTNQSGIARGRYGWDGFEDVQRVMLAALDDHGARVDMVLACGFHDSGQGLLGVADHPWRKPNPGMLLAAADALGLDLAASVVVGDRVADLVAGQRAGLGRGVLVRSGKAQGEQGSTAALAPSFHWSAADDLAAATDGVLDWLAEQADAASPSDSDGQ